MKQELGRRGRGPRAVLVVAAGLILAVAVGSGQGAISDPGRGKALYDEHCLRCHGSGLDGHGPNGRALIVPPANLRSVESRSKTDWELMVPIMDGVLFSDMHGWRGRLTTQDIRDVISFIHLESPGEEPQ